MIIRKRNRKIMTMNGILTINRSILCKKYKPINESQRCEIVPLDELLGIDRLPFKMTKSVMVEVAYVGQMMHSYESASKELYRRLGYLVCASLVREVTIYVGDIVYRHDLRRALETQRNIANSLPDIKHKLRGVLYILVDGSALNTRVKDNDGSTWRENKLGLCYVSTNVIRRRTKEKNGHTITKKEYTAFVGSSDEFRKFVYQIAVNQGYGRYETTIVLGDGASWIRTMCDEVFPDAIQILDYYHLEENVYDFAKAVFGNDADKYNDWAKLVIGHIMDGNTANALNEIDKYSDVKLYANVVNLNTYITGMRWNVNTAQPILSLRAKVESGLFASVVVPLVLNFNFTT